MKDFEFNQRVARLLSQARYDAGYSQQQVADALGVSKKTIQNWEDGSVSPSISKVFSFFKAIDRQPMPAFLEMLYEDNFKGISAKDEDERITRALIDIVGALPPATKRKLLYCAYGDHGSSALCVLELITAHLQTPLRDRINIANSVRMNYHIAKENGVLAGAEHIQPDVELLDKALSEAYYSVTNNKASYSVVITGEENNEE